MKYVKSNLTTIIIVLISISIVSIVVFLMSKDTKSQSIIKLPGIEFMSAYHQTPGAVLVDIRTPDEYSAGHIKDAINIDYYADDFSKKISELDKTKAYFIYCHSGNRSGRASTMMSDLGIQKIYDLQGGIGGNSQLLSL